jgi:hypothetical protein
MCLDEGLFGAINSLWISVLKTYLAEKSAIYAIIHSSQEACVRTLKLDFTSFYEKIDAKLTFSLARRMILIA